MSYELSIHRRKESPVHTATRLALDAKGRLATYTTYSPNTDYFDITPDTQPAILLANGWTAGRKVMGGIATHATQRGREEVVFDHQRETDGEEHPEDHKKETLKAVVVDYLDVFGGDGVDIVGHSEGGINSTKYAVDDIESGEGRVKSLTLVAPAGVLDLGAWALVGRGIKEIAAVVNPKHARHIVRLAKSSPEVRDYVRKNFKLTVAEIAAIAGPESQILADLQDMDAIEFPVGVIGCDYDKFFPGQALEEEIAGTVPFVRLETNHVDWLVDRRIQDDVYRIQQQIAHSALSRAA